MGFFRKFSLFQFIRNQDNYSTPLPLTFQQNKTIPTIYGGCFSLIHLVVTLLWLSYTTIELTQPSWNISAYTSTAIQDQFSSTANYTPGFMLLPTIQLSSQNTATLPQDNISEYFSVFYSLSDSTAQPSNYSRAVLCSSIPMVEQTVNFDTANALCPSTEFLSKVQLSSSREGPVYQLFMYVSFCDSANSLFPDDLVECRPYQESKERIYDFFIYQRTYTMLPDGDYVMGRSSTRSFDSNPQWLNAMDGKITQMQIMVKPLITTFSTNWFWSTFTNVENTYFKVQTSSMNLLPNTTINYDHVRQAIFYTTYSVGLSEDTVTWQRQDVISDISNFGGIMSLIVFIFSQILSPIVDFQQDLQLTKSMYTMHKKQDKKTKQTNDQSPNQRHLVQREPFDYPLSKQYCDCFKGNFCCLCQSCCKKCGQSKAGQRFEKARTLLYTEADIVGIMQQNRLSTFLSARHLRPHHLSLIRWFNEFLIHNDSDSDCGSDESDKDLASNFINRMVDQRELTPQSEAELKQIQRIKDGQAIRSQLHKQDYQDYAQWLSEQKTILEWMAIDTELQPDKDDTDRLALARIVGSKIQLNSENQQSLSEEFRQMIEDNINELESKAIDYDFIKRYNLKSGLYRRSSSIGVQKRESQFIKTREQAHTLAEDHVRLLMQDQGYSTDIQREHQDNSNQS